jgi:pilus assembly protein CpaF
VNVRGLDPYVAAEPSESDRTQAMSIVEGLVQRLQAAGELEEGVDLDGLRGTISRELLALGPLDELMKDETINEIHAVGGGPLRIVRRDDDRRGRERTVVTERRFSGDRALTLAIQRLARKWGFLVEGAHVLEGRVSDGFSMYALVPPSAVKTPVLSLRRTRSDASNLQALVQDGVLSKEMRDVLAAAVQGCLRVVVCASGGVNLDRFMQALVGEVPDSLRVLCISDTGRLGASRKGWVQVRRIADPTDGVMLSDALGVVMRGGVDLLIAQRCRHEDAAATIDALSGATRGAIVSLWGIDSAHALSRLAALSTVASGAIDALTVALARSVDVLVRLNVGMSGESMQVIELVEPRVREGNTVEHVSLFRAERGEDEQTVFTAGGVAPHFLRLLEAQGITTLSAKMFEA